MTDDTKTKPRIKGTVHLTAVPLTVHKPNVGDQLKPTPPTIVNGEGIFDTDKDPLGR